MTPKQPFRAERDLRVLGSEITGLLVLDADGVWWHGVLGSWERLTPGELRGVALNVVASANRQLEHVEAWLLTHGARGWL